MQLISHQPVDRSSVQVKVFFFLLFHLPHNISPYLHDSFLPLLFFSSASFSYSASGTLMLHRRTILRSLPSIHSSSSASFSIDCTSTPPRCCISIDDTLQPFIIVGLPSSLRFAVCSHSYFFFYPPSSCFPVSFLLAITFSDLSAICWHN